ncbi:MAG: hypothetical protein AB3N20_09105 [Rhizobiaceae bacterium]
MAGRSFSRQKGRSTFGPEINQVAGTSDRAHCFALLGLDPERSRKLGCDDTKRPVGRIDRMISRERQKGIGGHWSYDLNRHIALTQLREWLDDWQSRTAE